MTMVLNESGGDVAIVETGDAPTSSVSWAAILAGAVAAASVSLLLLLLGSGLGLAAISPWGSGASITTVAAAALAWLVAVHWISSAVGGYLAGRLRAGWTGVHRDEVTFRDTAHGFLSWGIAVLLLAALSGMAASSALFTGAQAVSTVAGGAAQGAAQGATSQAATGMADPTAYFVDTLFRPASPASGAAAPAGAGTGASTDVRAEVVRIFAQDTLTDDFPAADRTYLADIVAARTGVTPEAAKMRVDAAISSVQDIKAKAKDAADKARKAASAAAIGLVLALLVGAFVASVAAAFGGHLRDDPNA